MSCHNRPAEEMKISFCLKYMRFFSFYKYKRYMRDVFILIKTPRNIPYLEIKEKKKQLNHCNFFILELELSKIEMT